MGVVSRGKGVGVVSVGACGGGTGFGWLAAAVLPCPPAGFCGAGLTGAFRTGRRGIVPFNAPSVLLSLVRLGAGLPSVCVRLSPAGSAVRLSRAGSGVRLPTGSVLLSLARSFARWLEESLSALSFPSATRPASFGGAGAGPRGCRLRLRVSLASSLVLCCRFRSSISLDLGSSSAGSLWGAGGSSCVSCFLFLMDMYLGW